MKIKDHRGRPKKYNYFLAKKGDFGSIAYNKSARQLIYNTAKRHGYKIATQVIGKTLNYERQS